MSTALFRHPQIWTGSAESPWTTALLVADGVITAVGDDAVAHGGDAVHLPGALVMPGLHDAHLHTAWTSSDLASVDLRDALTLDEALGLLGDHAASLPAGRSISSGRW
ncbi:MAG: amidohydrolase family protein, partial [Dermatophilaceae bacterium]